MNIKKEKHILTRIARTEKRRWQIVAITMSINELKFRKLTRGCILAIIQTNNLQRSLERKSRKIKDIRKLVSPNRGSGTITGITGRPGINIRSFGCREKPGASRNFLRRKKILKSCIAVLNRRIVKKEIARLALEDD